MGGRKKYWHSLSRKPKAEKALSQVIQVEEEPDRCECGTAGMAGHWWAGQVVGLAASWLGMAIANRIADLQASYERAREKSLSAVPASTTHG